MPSGYHPGIPQNDQAYTKWDADRDEVEVDFKQLEQRRQSSWFSGAKGTVLRILLVLVTFLLGLILGYVIRRSVSDPMDGRLKCPYVSEGYQRYSVDLSKQVTRLISKDNIQDNLRNYTEVVHITGTQENNVLGNMITDQLKSFGLMVTTSKYRVLLSYPNWEKPNTVYLLAENGSAVYQTGYSGPPNKDRPDLTTPYLAFAPNGTITGDLMYANYGEVSDFSSLGSCKNNIVIMRYGKIFRGDKVKNAFDCGATGVVLYSDPADVTFHMKSDKDVYPHTWYMPGWAAQRGSIFQGVGDPLSPGLPAKDGIYRIPMSEAKLPQIPAQPIGYDDAQNLMMYMKGTITQDFIGAMHMNVTYRTGPGYNEPRESWKVKLEVNNENILRDVTNIMAVIKGHEEPDRYVIVGVHYDAWTTGASDPNAATAALTEIARSIAAMEKTGWKPRRTIMFMFWDGEEQGLMGSTEWVEEHMQQLRERTVAYINMDAGIRGNYSLRVHATPEIRNLMYNVTKMYPPAAPTPETATMFDEWSQRSSTSSCSKDSVEPTPKIHNVGFGSDQAPFLFTLGVPILWPRYIHDTCIMKKFPAYHTDIDNFDYQTRFIDPGFLVAESYSNLITEMVLQLSGLTRLPYDVRGLAQAISDSFNDLKTVLTQDSIQKKHLLDPLHWAIGNFTDLVAPKFHDNFQQVDIKDILAIRRYNDKAMKVSQAFIYPEGLPGRPQYKNILYAPSLHNAYSGATFTGIHDAVASYMKAKTSKEQNLDELWQTVEKQISIATLAVQKANSFLNEDYFP